MGAAGNDRPALASAVRASDLVARVGGDDWVGELHPHEVELPAFWIYRDLVTIGQYHRFMLETGHEEIALEDLHPIVEGVLARRDGTAGVERYRAWQKVLRRERLRAHRLPIGHSKNWEQ